ncbi:hypothetical protein EAG_08573 [Camponotus floridanus]|uniref:Uncharacterized protein n=1 Tax=Camponotus floridanus TaxID=104421 RepID=E1ZWX0_CAMFO|nr:hypothetical protein EAG_08573 [Camponotus floridanus]
MPRSPSDDVVSLPDKDSIRRAGERHRHHHHRQDEGHIAIEDRFPSLLAAVTMAPVLSCKQCSSGGYDPFSRLMMLSLCPC